MYRTDTSIPDHQPHDQRSETAVSNGPRSCFGLHWEKALSWHSMMSATSGSVRVMAFLILCAGPMSAKAAVGDHECIVNFDIGKVDSIGQYTSIGITALSFPVSQYTVILAAGERLRFLRIPPGLPACYSVVGLRVHQHDGVGYATQYDPIVDTLPISSILFAELTEAGSYYLQGITLDSQGPFSTGRMKIIIVLEQAGLSTTIGMQQDKGEHLQLWPSAGGLVLQSETSGELTITNVAGQFLTRHRANASSAPQWIPWQALPGIYVALLSTENGILRRRFFWP